MLSNFTRVRGRRIAAATAIVASLGAGAVALANDTTFIDGDTGVATPNLAYGSGTNAHDCATRGQPVSGDVVISYNGNGLDTSRHFSPNELLLVDFAPESGSGVTVTPGADTHVPSTWGSSPTDSVTIPFTTTVPLTRSANTYVEATVTGQTSQYSAGDSAGSGKPRFQINIDCGTGVVTPPANVTPVVAFKAPTPSTTVEGTPQTYDFSIDDSDVNDVQSYAAGFPSCGSLGTVSGTPTITATGGSFSCAFPDGLAPATSSDVSVQVSDGTSLSNTATTSTTVTNAKPAVGALTVTVPSGDACLTGKPVGLGFGFSDAGLIDDPWAVDVDWGTGQTATGDSTSDQTSPLSYSHTYFGAGDWTVSATVTDKDHESGTNTSAAGAVALRYSTGQGILQPINYTGPRSEFKIGSTIPVKIKIVDCDGNPVSGLAPQVSFKYVGTLPPTDTVSESVVSTVPDQGTSMRYTGSPDYQYIFNLATKGKSAGGYTVTVSLPGVINAVSAPVGLKK
jgi:hypothetical protein